MYQNDRIRDIDNFVPGRQDMQYVSIVQNQCKCIDIQEYRKSWHLRRPEKFQPLLKYIMLP